MADPNASCTFQFDWGLAFFARPARSMPASGGVPMDLKAPSVAAASRGPICRYQLPEALSLYRARKAALNDRTNDIHARFQKNIRAAAASLSTGRNRASCV